MHTQLVRVALTSALRNALDRIPDDTKVIPGHGPLTDKRAIENSANMIEATRALVKRGLDAGQSVEQIVAAGLGLEWASHRTGFINEERWIRILATNLAGGT